MRTGLVIVCGLALVGCAPPWDAYDWKVDGPYRLWAADDPADAELCKDLPERRCGLVLVEGGVFQTGFDDRYIVVGWRSPETHSHFEARDTAGRDTRYFYVFRANDAVTGPLDAGAFEEARARLGLPQPHAIP